jgi:fructokinase
MSHHDAGTARSTTAATTPLVVGLGESLFDLLPGGPVLGGAPINVAVHMQQLFELLGVRGGRAAVATRVGRDELGDRFCKEIADRGLDISAVQRDDARPTGTAVIELVAGEPSFEITKDSAWDQIAFDAGWRSLAARAHAVCFGTLGRRTAAAGRVIEEFLTAAPQAVRVFDVNLRAPFYSADSIRSGCRLATILKLNEGELALVADMLGLPAAPAQEQIETLRHRERLEAVVLTRGLEGSWLASAAGITTAAARQYPRRPDADAVGAGDAFAAAVIVGRLLGWTPPRSLEVASRVSGFVASQPGATPRLPADLLMA